LGIDKNDKFIVDPLPICLRDTAFIVKKAACGKSHCLFVDKSGFLFSMGSNEYGQLGINDIVMR
jgi:alpha-tubulin suppressor-like RCC1 family protein